MWQQHSRWELAFNFYILDGVGTWYPSCRSSGLPIFIWVWFGRLRLDIKRERVEIAQEQQNQNNSS